MDELTASYDPVPIGTAHNYLTVGPDPSVYAVVFGPEPGKIPRPGDLEGAISADRAGGISLRDHISGSRCIYFRIYSTNDPSKSALFFMCPIHNAEWQRRLSAIEDGIKLARSPGVDLRVLVLIIEHAIIHAHGTRKSKSGKEARTDSLLPAEISALRRQILAKGNDQSWFVGVLNSLRKGKDFRRFWRDEPRMRLLHLFDAPEAEERLRELGSVGATVIRPFFGAPGTLLAVSVLREEGEVDHAILADNSRAEEILLSRPEVRRFAIADTQACTFVDKSVLVRPTTRLPDDKRGHVVWDSSSANAEEEIRYSFFDLREFRRAVRVPVPLTFVGIKNALECDIALHGEPRKISVLMEVRGKELVVMQTPFPIEMRFSREVVVMLEPSSSAGFGL